MGKADWKTATHILCLFGGFESDKGKADWKTATHILCLFGVFESDNANKSSLLKECAWANVSTSNITLVYHDIPPADNGIGNEHNCTVNLPVVCDEAWLQK